MAAMPDTTTPAPDRDQADRDRYEVLFGSDAFDRAVDPTMAGVADDDDAPTSRWRRLAENSTYEMLNLWATYVAVFFAPLIAGAEMAAGAEGATLSWSVQLALWVEVSMAVFFAFDTLVGLLAYGVAYLKTPACWINVLAVGSTGMALFAHDLGLANPRVLRILRTVRAVAKVGLVQKVGTRETVLGAEMLRQMGRDDAWYAVGILLLISMLGDFSLGNYGHWSDPLLEIVIYAGMVLAVRWKAERNVERVGQVFMDRLREANGIILKKMSEIPGLEDADRLIEERADQRRSEGRSLNEIDTLVEAIGMIIANLRRFISRRAFLEAKGEHVIPTRSPVALMFTDVAGFHDATRRMGPDVLPVLQAYLSEMNSGVIDHGGDIDKFIGEGIFAYFHDKSAPGREADAAYDAAVAMYRSGEALNAANEVWDELFRDHDDWQEFRQFKTRFGLHFGEVVAGPVGSEERADSTLIGDNVNLAARLESLNDDYDTAIIVSAAFVERLSADRRVSCRRIDKVQVPERDDEAMDVFVVDVDPLPVGFLLAFENGLAHYLDGNWARARARLIEARDALAAAGLGPDGATEALIHRIEATNAFWHKAIKHLRDRVPDEFTEAAAANLVDRLGASTFLPPADWPGYWRH